MHENNFSIQRINESFKQAESLYNSQILLGTQNKSTDFSLVIPYCDEIKIIKDTAFEARYEFEAFLIFYNESITRQMNSSSIELIISEIHEEFTSERYENVKPLVEKAYQETISVKSSYTSLNVFYKATTKSLKQFFIDNWVYIASVIVFILLILIIFRRPFLKYRLKRKISYLQLRKTTLKELIMRTQEGYFNKGNVSEGTYNLRTKKFADLVRDIDRQIPLLEEEYIKLEKKIK
jgi:hypothetical protein